MKFLQQVEIEVIIKKSPPGRNTDFLKSSHNLWVRFKNYSKSLPLALVNDHKVVSIIFVTFNKNLYANLYEIVTMQGEEGNGYARQLWAEFICYATQQKGMTRLKISCTPSSLTWHLKNGLIFWAIDSSGSLKSDQPLFPSIDSQRTASILFAKNYKLALPKPDVADNFRTSQLNNFPFGAAKRKRVREAIEKAGAFWLGDNLG